MKFCCLIAIFQHKGLYFGGKPTLFIARSNAGQKQHQLKNKKATYDVLSI